MSYDVFLSHSHVDKDRVRKLHDALAGQEYSGRALRVWLDVRVLDPGELSSGRELESALDRSRRLILVLTRAALKSTWVRHEIDYFSGLRSKADILVMRLQACDVPDDLSRCLLIDWPPIDDDAQQLAGVLRFLRPLEDEHAEYAHRRAVRRCFGNARYGLPPDYQPEPTPVAGEMLAALTAADIGDLDQEGLALAGFDSAGQCVAELDAKDSYAMRMVLGEILAICMLRDPAWAAVSRGYIAKDYGSDSKSSFLTLRNRALRGKTGQPATTNLLFAVAESMSKLAAIDPARVDLSTLAALLARLDRHDSPGEQQEILARMLGRTLGKLRGMAAVVVLIHALVKWGGNAAQLAAAAAISIAFERLLDSEDFYTSELAQRAGDAPPPALKSPSPDIARLLFEPYSELATNIDLMAEIRNCREEFKRNFGAPDEAPWPAPRYLPARVDLVNGPIVGVVRRVTLANMETLAGQIGPGDIACLTEPRIVDALFENAGAFLVDELEADAPLGERLGRRNVRFASFKQDDLQRFEDGQSLVLWPASKIRRATGLLA